MKDTLCDILRDSKNIAVVGLSKSGNRTSNQIAAYLTGHGYNVAGVNPTADLDNINGIPVYKSLKDIPFKIDIVDVFRRSETIDELIPDVIERQPNVFWLQSGIRNDKAVSPLRHHGIIVVQDECIMVNHNRCFN